MEGTRSCLSPPWKLQQSLPNVEQMCEMPTVTVVLVFIDEDPCRVKGHTVDCHLRSSSACVYLLFPARAEEAAVV